MSLSRRAFTFGLTGTAVVGLAGCGSTDDDQPTAATSAGGSDVFPVTIKHARGSTTIEAKPERVVTIGYTDHETVLALGTVPVGVVDWFSERPYGDWPWIKDLWGDQAPEIVSVTGGGVNFEKVASLQPDLIIGLYAGDDDGTMNKENFERFSALAPTVAHDPDSADYTTAWTTMARVAGQALGEGPKIEELITAVEEKFATAREDHPEFADQEAAVVDAGGGAGELYPFSSKDPRGQFLASLGFAAPTELDKAIGDQFGMMLPAESITLLDIDRLLLLINPDAEKKLDQDKVYQNLDVVKRGDDVRIPYDVDSKVGAALAFNTVLSIPYGIDTVLPLLEK